MVLSDGAYDLITEATMDSDWDENGYQTALRSHIKTKIRRPSTRSNGKVLSLIPLRNRRKSAGRRGAQHPHHRGDDRVSLPRQAVGYGLSEYLDQIVDGRPSGVDHGSGR